MQFQQPVAAPLPLTAPSAPATTAAPAVEGSVQKWSVSDYYLGPNDVISIKVFGFPDLSHERIKVQPDGQIILEMLGPIKVEGLTLTELDQLLIEKYQRFLKNPLVTVDILTTKAFLVYITGAVLSPGSYEILTNPIDNSIYNGVPISIDRRTPLLSSALVASGGLNYDADLEHIRIENKLTGNVQTVNLLELLKNNNTQQDVFLKRGDTVVVPRYASPLAVSEENYRVYLSSSLSPKTIPVKVFGYVNTPGLVNLNTAQSQNLLSAITAAGGYLTTQAYSPKKVYIFRADHQGHLATKIVNPLQDDPVIFPNDIVYVPDKFRPNAGRFFDYISRISAPFQLQASIYRNLSGKSLFNNP